MTPIATGAASPMLPRRSITREVEAEGSKEDFEKAFKKVAKEKPEKAKR